MRVPITPEMTCNKAINLIVDKMTEREREQLRMDCNSDFELRHLNDDDVDFHQPPIDPTMYVNDFKLLNYFFFFHVSGILPLVEFVELLCAGSWQSRTVWQKMMNTGTMGKREKFQALYR